jgi:hypothetical protein
MSVKDKNNFVRVHNATSSCYSKSTCLKCKRNHHTMLHYDEIKRTFVPKTEPKTEQAKVNITEEGGKVTNTDILLATAQIR